MHELPARSAATIARVLDDGEAVVAATPGAPRGAMRALAHGDGPRRPTRNPVLTAGYGQLQSLGIPYAAQYVIVLTDRRVLWFRTTFTGRPKALVAAMHRGELDDGRVTAARALGQAYAQLTLRVRDGREVTFDVARVHVEHAQEFAAACKRATAA
jgi:hypothetical protein